MSAEPLSREERDHYLKNAVPHSPMRAWEATVDAETERAEQSEAKRFLLRLAILAARDLMDEAHREERPAMAHHLRIGADKILHDALAADDAVRADPIRPTPRDAPVMHADPESSEITHDQ